MPHGGLYVVGNIAVKILTKPPFDKNFMLAFSNKDKVSYVLKDIPVWVVLNTEVGLQGTENYAFKSTLALVSKTDSNSNQQGQEKTEL
jgi:glucokinase